jgi:Ala-tRNA(Pro) deacylase
MDVQQFLDEKGVDYEVIPHEEVYTAQEVAAAEHVTGHKFAKPVIVEGEEEVYMLVLPASRKVDFDEAAALVGEDVQMASEEEMQRLFPDSEIGAESPFGSQYGLKTYVDESLAACDEIVFRGGSHEKTIKMSWADYRQLEEPALGEFSYQPE